MIEGTGVGGDRALPAKARAALVDQENECLISIASAWKLAIKAGLGKLKLALPVEHYVVRMLPMGVPFPTASRTRVSDLRLARAAVENSADRSSSTDQTRISAQSNGASSGAVSAAPELAIREATTT